jgi:hypothetical protein
VKIGADLADRIAPPHHHRRGKNGRRRRAGWRLCRQVAASRGAGRITPRPTRVGRCSKATRSGRRAGLVKFSLWTNGADATWAPLGGPRINLGCTSPLHWAFNRVSRRCPGGGLTALPGRAGGQRVGTLAGLSTFVRCWNGPTPHVCTSRCAAVIRNTFQVLFHKKWTRRTFVCAP